FILHTSVGECAGVVIDLVATLLYESEEKLSLSKETIGNGQYADSIYHSYSTFINTAKALLLSVDVRPSTQYQVITEFQTKFVDSGLIEMPVNFKEYLFRINKNEPTESFALEFMTDASRFVEHVQAYRNSTVKEPVPVVAEK
ncbi:MAG: HEPN domain-containing protein, partial [Bacteroidota bacterium]